MTVANAPVPPPVALGEAVAEWLFSVVGLAGPLSFELIGAGGSNLTYIVTDAGNRRVVVRRPPVGSTLATAHDMRREWKVLYSLAGSGSPVPIPAPLAWLEPTGDRVGMYAMSCVEGRVLRTGADGSAMSVGEVAAASGSFVETLSEIHSVDCAAVGLEEFGRAEGYVERQLFRWRRQYESAKVRELPLLEQIGDRLGRTVPRDQRPGSLVHGDFRFENLVLGKDSRVAAVLDWELSTRGDPVADFFWALQYWAEPGDAFTMLPDPPTAIGTFPGRETIMNAYGSRTGLDLSEERWYRSFTWWKQAALVEGVYARRLAGVTAGAPTTNLGAIAARVDRLLSLAAEPID